VRSPAIAGTLAVVALAATFAIVASPFESDSKPTLDSSRISGTSRTSISSERGPRSLLLHDDDAGITISLSEGTLTLDASARAQGTAPLEGELSVDCRFGSPVSEADATDEATTFVDRGFSVVVDLASGAKTASTKSPGVPESTQKPVCNVMRPAAGRDELLAQATG